MYQHADCRYCKLLVLGVTSGPGDGPMSQFIMFADATRTLETSSREGVSFWQGSIRFESSQGEARFAALHSWMTS